MEPGQKRILRGISLALRHELEGWRDERDVWRPGDLERRLAELGIWRDRAAKPLDEMPHLVSDDRAARVVVDGYLHLRAEAGVGRDEAVAEFVRESAYTWANRLLALRCMEARSIIEEVILQKSAYAGRSLVHHRFLHKNPAAAAGTDDGLFSVLFAQFAERAAELPALFDPHAASVALRPSVAALKRCVALLGGAESVRGQEPAGDEVFSAPDAFGWAYQYWNTEEKDRVFEAVRTKKGTKIEGADIIPATQLYTEPYMVKFLVQNSLGALWMSLHPDSRLRNGWEYYVRDADRASDETAPGGRSVREFTFLDPALGSGHFHLEAFDLFFAMYREENSALTPREIAASILNRNLFGIDLDERAVQIAEAALWMKAKDAAPELEAADLDTFHDHLVATNIRLPRGRDHLEAFLSEHPEDAPLRPALEMVFRGLEHADELGSLLQIEEPVDRELRRLKAVADSAVTTPPVQPDMFRATAVQSSLPLGVESYEAWKADALDRLETHFEQEAEAADSVRAFFGVSARKGLALFDLFARRYDIVAANPPYMGSKNMGIVLKRFVERSYPAGKRDLYAAFILRCLEFGDTGSRVAMVTQQSWMFLGSYLQLRATTGDADAGPDAPVGFQGILLSATVEVLVQLGRYAFSEIGNALVQPVPFVLRKQSPALTHRLWACRLIAPRPAGEQAALLRAAVYAATPDGHRGAGDARFVFRQLQSRFLNVPQSPLCYWLRERFFELWAGKKVGDVAVLAEPTTTGNSDRYLRAHWEASGRVRWFVASRGGGYSKWTGLKNWVLDWEHNGARVRAASNSFVRNASLMFNEGITYTEAAYGALGCRLLESGETFCKSGPGIFFPNTAAAYLAVLNSRISSYFLRITERSFISSLGDIARLPVIEQLPPLLDRCTRFCVAAKRAFVAESPIENDARCMPQFASSLRGSNLVAAHQSNANCAMLHSVEGAAERLVFDAYRLESDDEGSVLGETDRPVGWFPIVDGYDAIHGLVNSLESELSALIRLSRYERLSLSAQQLAVLKQRLRQHYEIGPGRSPDTADIEEARDEESAEETAVRADAQLPIPAETFIEELSQKLELHPIAVFWLLEEGIEKEGWRCFPEEKRLTENRFTVLVLRILGHRWPKQIDDPLPVWADRDGVIPLSSGSSEPTLATRVLERLGVEFPDSDSTMIRAEFQEIVGTPLEAWLANGFFARHIPQFKTRPIAWQIQSRPAVQPGRRRSAPACGPVFACLVYYHRLDADLLPKLRSHYLDVLRTARETELRTLEALAQPTPDQGARKVELELLVDQLNDFDAKLQGVVETGFGPAPLQPRLRQLAVDDAVLAMKARWLTRLRDTLQAGSLAGWQADATALDHDADFAGWIADAIAHLPNHCAKSGAKSPDAAKLPEDTTPTTLAAVICAESDAMTTTALDLACVEWRHEWETHVIQPLRARIASDNSALEALASELETMVRSKTARVEEIAREQKRLRAELKTLKAEIKTKTVEADRLAGSIREWASPELPTWESWLASSPLFDEVSSLDGHHGAPSTVRDFILQESLYAPDLNDGVRVNIAPLQRAGLLAADVIAGKDVDKAIADRAEWRADERRWVREGKLPHPGWWVQLAEIVKLSVPTFDRALLPPEKYAIGAVIALLQRAGGSCATMRLAGAYSLLVKRELLELNAPPEVAKFAKKWRQRSRRQNVEISLFRAALDELRERDVLIPEERDGRTFERLSPQGLAFSSEDWLRVDAALALSTIDALDAARQEPILEEYPADERLRWVA